MDYQAKARDGSTGELASGYRLIEVQPNLLDRLVYLSQPLPDKPYFLLHRLLAGLTEAINTCFRLHKDLLRKSLPEKLLSLRNLALNYLRRISKLFLC